MENLLTAAILANQPSIIQYLITHGAKITPPIESALLQSNNIDLYRILLPIGLLNLNDPLQQSGGYVVSAVSNDNLELLTLLLETGADPDGGGRFEWMPAIAVAIEEGKDLDVIKLLVRYGADVKRKGLLALAASEGRVDVCEYLLDRGVDIDEDVGDCVLLPHDKGSALHVAATLGEIDVVKLLAGRGAEVDLEDEDGKTALDKARKAGCDDVVAFLQSS